MNIVYHNLFRRSPMDDEAKQILREIRDLLVKADTRETAWIEEIRPAHSESTRLSKLCLKILFCLIGIGAIVAVWLIVTRFLGHHDLSPTHHRSRPGSRACITNSFCNERADETFRHSPHA